MSEPIKDPIVELQCVARTSAGDEAVKVTVGEIFTLECQSDSISINPSQARILAEVEVQAAKEGKETKEGQETKKVEDPYILKVLKTDINPQGKWILQVVSYKVGPYNEFPFQLTDGINVMPIKGVSFQVESVIDPQNPPQGPLGPYGPFLTEFPWGALAVLLSVLAIIIFAIGLKAVRLIKKKRLKERMKQYDSAQAPIPQFYAEMRKLQREMDFVYQGKLSGAAAMPFLKKFESALKLYLVRQFEIPAFEFKSQAVISDFRNRFAWFGEDVSNQLGVLIRELEKSQYNENAITAQDVQQLYKNLKRWVDRTSCLTDKFVAKGREL